MYMCCVLSRSVLSYSLPPHGLQPTRLLCPQRFSRQEYWSELPCPPPGDLPNPEVNPRLQHCRRILYCLSHQGSRISVHTYCLCCKEKFTHFCLYQGQNFFKWLYWEWQNSGPRNNSHQRKFLEMEIDQLKRLYILFCSRFLKKDNFYFGWDVGFWLNTISSLNKEITGIGLSVGKLPNILTMAHYIVVHYLVSNKCYLTF